MNARREKDGIGPFRYGQPNPSFPFSLFPGMFPVPEVFRNTILVLTSLTFALVLLFTGEINITLYPAHILDPTCAFFSSVGLCLVD